MEQQAAGAREGSIAVLSALHEISANPARSFAGQVEALLEMGCKRFGLSIGILAQVVGEQYRVVKVFAPDADIRDAQVFELGSTYCRDTLRADGPILFEHASQTRWKSHPAYHSFGLEAYVGIPIRVRSKVYGTLNFSSPVHRVVRFTTDDEDVLRLMAQWVGGELERLRLQEELAQQERLSAIGRTAATLAHEVGNPLNALALNATLVERYLKKMPPDDVVVVLEKMGLVKAEIKRMSRLLDRFRMLTRDQILTKKPIDLRRLVGEVAMTLAAEFQSKNIRHRKIETADTGPIVVAADRDKVKQALFNICKNAIEAMPDGGELSIGVEVAADNAVISVADTGPGIPADVDVFSPFKTTKTDGSGLGLSIVKEILDQHGGAVHYQPRAEGGTVFHLELPLS